jgi:2-alkenal reductase
MEVGNRKVVLKRFITGIPEETDMEVKEGEKIILQVPEEAKVAVLVKNLYLSCDPYMRGRMREFYESYIPPFQPGSVCLLFISLPYSLIFFVVNYCCE